MRGHETGRVVRKIENDNRILSFRDVAYVRREVSDIERSALKEFRRADVEFLRAAEDEQVVFPFFVVAEDGLAGRHEHAREIR